MNESPQTEQELLARAQLGRSAEELLAEPFIDRWFTDTQNALLAMLREGTPEDAAHWHRMMDAVDKLRATLDHYLRTGALATRELQEKMHPLEQLSRFKFRRRDSALT